MSENALYNEYSLKSIQRRQLQSLASITIGTGALGRLRGQKNERQNNVPSPKKAANGF